MQKLNDERPGDLFIDRYMPHATVEQREEAYQNVRQLIAVLVRINERLRREEEARRDSPESESRGRVRKAAKPPQSV